MENIKVDMSDHGTWTKYSTVRESVYVMPCIAAMLRFTEHRNFLAGDTPSHKEECSSPASLHFPNQIPLYVPK
jgi:hypothetical protein